MENMGFMDIAGYIIPVIGAIGLFVYLVKRLMVEEKPEDTISQKTTEAKAEFAMEDVEEEPAYTQTAFQDTVYRMIEEGQKNPQDRTEREAWKEKRRFAKSVRDYCNMRPDEYDTQKEWDEAYKEWWEWRKQEFRIREILDTISVGSARRQAEISVATQLYAAPFYESIKKRICIRAVYGEYEHVGEDYIISFCQGLPLYYKGFMSFDFREVFEPGIPGTLERAIGKSTKEVRHDLRRYGYQEGTPAKRYRVTDYGINEKYKDIYNAFMLDVIKRAQNDGIELTVKMNSNDDRQELLDFPGTMRGTNSIWNYWLVAECTVSVRKPVDSGTQSEQNTYIP